VKRRLAVAYVIITQALICWALWRTFHVAQTSAVVPPPVHHFAAVEPASPSWYANERASGRLWLEDPSFAGGAVGDDSHDDTAAINAALAYAKGTYSAGGGGVTGVIAGTIYVRQPPVAYAVNAEIPIQFPVSIIGDTGNTEHTIFRAHTAANSVFTLRSSFGLPNLNTLEDQSAARARLQGITLDANHLTNYALKLIGAEFSSIENVRAVNALDVGIYDANSVLGMTLTSVTCTGTCSPGTVTVTQPNPFFTGLPFNNPPFTFNLVAKITTGGALNTAQYAISIDNGVTYAGGSQPVAPLSTMAKIDNVGFVQGIYGFVLAFPAGTYTVNDLYKFNSTSQTADFAVSLAGNAQMTFRDIVTNSNGPIYYSSGMNLYGGYNITLVPGTVATTAGSPFLIGTGTSFEAMRGAGYSRAVVRLRDGGSNDNTYQAYILSDTVLSVVHGEEPASTLSSLAYSVGTGGGYYEDGLIDGPDQHWDSGNSAFDSVCFSFNGLIGPSFFGPTLSSCGMAGVSVGGGNASQPAQNNFINFHVASEAGGVAAFLLSPYSQGRISLASGALAIVGGGNGWIYEQSGGLSPLIPYGANSWLSQYVLQMVPSAQTFTSASQAFVLPSFTSLQGTNTGFIKTTFNGNYLLTAAPTIPAPPGNRSGVFLIIENDAFSLGPTATFQTDALSSTGLGLEAPYVTLGPKEVIAFVSTGASIGNGPKWQQVWKSARNYGSASHVGNLGDGVRVIQTTSSTTPTEIYKVDVNNSGIAPATVLNFDLVAESQNGANYGSWLDCVLTWNLGGTRSPLACDMQIGSGSNNSIPLGWAMSVDPSGTSPFAKIYFAGDSSANTVTASIHVRHRDPGQ
jgi:hypothetical protein